MKPPTPCMDEQQAVTRLKQGDLTGLEFLVRHFQVQAVQSAYLILGDRPLAEDVVQAAFIKIAAKISQFDPQRPFRPWFLRIVIHDAIKAAHRNQRSISLDTDSANLMEWLEDPARSPEDWAETAELRQKVWIALEQLPAEQRAVIVMRHFLEMDEQEMTDHLKRPASTIKWRLHAARQQLKKLLSAYWIGGSE